MNGRKSFSKNTKRNVFEKLRTIKGYDQKIWRIDEDNEIICFPSYGDVNSQYGWNIHHINNDHRDNRLSNLRAVSFSTHDKLH